MGKYIRMTRTYLVLATVFVVLRFVLELAGINENVTSEISLTRYLLVLPVFLSSTPGPVCYRGLSAHRSS